MKVLFLCGNSLVNSDFTRSLEGEAGIVMLVNEAVAKEEPELFQQLSRRCAEVRTYDDYSSNGFVEIDAIELHAKYGFEAIVAAYEHDIQRAASLREYLGIKGQTPDSANAYRDKVAMKALAQKSGLNVPRFRTIRTATDLYAFTRQAGFPVFVKPVYASGSFGAAKLSNESEMRAFISTATTCSHRLFAFTESYEVEECVGDDIYSVNGVVLGGKVALAHAARYSIHPDLDQIAKHGYCSSLMLDPKTGEYGRLRRYTERLIAALPSAENMVFHAELFMSPGGKVTLCEIASRLPGGGIIPAMNQAYGLNFYDIGILTSVDGRRIDKPLLAALDKAPKCLAASVLVHPAGGIFKSAAGSCPLPSVVEYTLLAREKVNYTRTGNHSCDGAARFVVTAGNERDLRKNSEAAAKWFLENSSWGQPKG